MKDDMEHKNSIASTKRAEKFAFGIIKFCGIITIIILVAIIGKILINGIPHLSWDFLTKEPEIWGEKEEFFPLL